MSEKIQSGRDPHRVKPSDEELAKRWAETFGKPKEKDGK